MQGVFWLSKSRGKEGRFPYTCTFLLNFLCSEIQDPRYETSRMRCQISCPISTGHINPNPPESCKFLFANCRNLQDWGYLRVEPLQEYPGLRLLGDFKLAGIYRIQVTRPNAPHEEPAGFRLLGDFWKWKILQDSGYVFYELVHPVSRWNPYSHITYLTEIGRASCRERV